MGTSPGPARPRVPRLLVLLLGVAGAATPRTRQVNGVLGGSALLSLDLPPDKKVKAIEWTFLGVGSVKITVAEFDSGKFKRPDPQDRFRGRVEMNKTELRIGTLERGDSGVYEARIKLEPATVETQLFTLSVYEPVPEPQIQGQRLSLTPRECNLTLRCQAPPGSNATVTWQLGGSLGVPQAQLCGDNQTLCLALPVAAFNSTYTCLARNPAQERNVSLHLDTLCQQQGKKPLLCPDSPPQEVNSPPLAPTTARPCRHGGLSEETRVPGAGGRGHFGPAWHCLDLEEEEEEEEEA
ncbi:SLAM family member 8-like [Pipra filicauda]|uniref:SLAM family member 8-like n=1 Tax=Pipra filicauda TaxID=649802 RepID=A0A7R5KZV4_9PASS|nr:SLAM family member 8-like [Pipra filicauda]